MRFLFAVMASRSGEVVASSDEMGAIDTFNEQLVADGHHLMAAGVAAPDRAVLFDNREGSGLVTDGPAVNSDLFMAGFWVIEAENEPIAHRLAAEASLACNRLIEVRPFLG